MLCYVILSLSLYIYIYIHIHMCIYPEVRGTVAMANVPASAALKNIKQMSISTINNKYEMITTTYDSNDTNSNNSKTQRLHSYLVVAGLEVSLSSLLWAWRCSCLVRVCEAPPSSNSLSSPSQPSLSLDFRRPTQIASSICV